MLAPRSARTCRCPALTSPTRGAHHRPQMPAAYRIAVLGFSEFERRTLASCFRLATGRDQRYVQEPLITAADYIVADADHAPSVQLVAAIERMGETVFVGHRAPPDARAWMARPIDPLHVMRELDALVVQNRLPDPPVAGDGEPPSTAVQAVQREQAADEASPLLQRRDPTPPAAPAPPATGATPAASARQRQPDAPAEAPAAAPAVVLPPPSALLVDDSEIALRYLETRLQRWGMRIDRASSSGQAIALLAQRDYDFVFLDLELGDDSELDGLALCHHIKRNQGEGAALGSSVFIVSAHQTELDRVRGALAGCDAYLGKPLQDIDLRRLLVRHGLKPPPAPPREDIEAI